MRKKKPLYISLIVLLLIISVLVVPAMADAGNFSGSSDFGGSSGGGYSGSYDDSYSGSYSGSSGGLTGGAVAIIVVLFIVFYIIKKPGRVSEGAASQTAAYPALMPIRSLIDSDPNFSEAAMKEKIGNLYVRMQAAWQAKEFDVMRPYMTDALYSQFKLQLDELIRSECTNHVERIAVMETELLGWRSEETVDAVVVRLQTRIIDYISNDRTGKLISGSRTAEKFMTYEWTLVRSKGMKTPGSSDKGNEDAVTIHCPSCGAPVEINQSAKCPYCDSVLNAVSYDWVISEIKGISQRTA
ncbi:MAG: zinc-ribbon domain-containing transport protein [Oscillospiraceae bacterium]|nr:zinc-ribbon domain-containing transport protein [Oscillospiraceae bacterium]